jgi:hypothetical protein
MSNSTKNVTENLAYSDILVDISELGEAHKAVVKDIELVRHTIEDRAIYDHKNYFVNGHPEVLTKENYAKASNIQRSREYDSLFTKNFLFNKSDYLAKAGQN